VVRPRPSPEIAERRRKALDLRMAGVDTATIAKTLGIREATVLVDISRLLAALRTEDLERVDAYRALEATRLDRMQAAVWAQAVHGEEAAIRSVLRIMERRARLWGLDAPTQVQVLTVDAVEAEIARLERQIAARQAGIVDGEVVTADDEAARFAG
jgi:hypothetical protein